MELVDETTVTKHISSGTRPNEINELIIFSDIKLGNNPETGREITLRDVIEDTLKSATELYKAANYHLDNPELLGPLEVLRTNKENEIKVLLQNNSIGITPRLKSAVDLALRVSTEFIGDEYIGQGDMTAEERENRKTDLEKFQIMMGYSIHTG